MLSLTLLARVLLGILRANPALFMAAKPPSYTVTTLLLRSLTSTLNPALGSQSLLA